MGDTPLGMLELSFEEVAYLLQFPDVFDLLAVSPSPRTERLSFLIGSPEFPVRSNGYPVGLRISGTSQLVGDNRWDHWIYATREFPSQHSSTDPDQSHLLVRLNLPLATLRDSVRALSPTDQLALAHGILAEAHARQKKIARHH